MYETFKTELIAVITKKLEAPYKVETYKAFKNGKEIDAFTIRQKDTQATPTFYFKNLIEDYRNGSSVADIAEDNTTYVVSVIDILNATDNLKKVQVLSGLADK